MADGVKLAEQEGPSPRESGEDSEDDNEILEESPCGRWSKRRVEVQQRDVPGLDAAFLAMDNEECMEVVWNEMRFSERRQQQERGEDIKAAFNRFTKLEHNNIVKLHSFWLDLDLDKRRIVFITEYMSSGSLRKFLKLSKRNDKKVHISSWKKWCIQILSALRYLHESSPAIVHGNLTPDTIFIQSNGLIKISSVAPDIIHTHVKTYKTEMKNMHYIAPEYAADSVMSPSVDVYSVGMCALEMAALEISDNGDSGHSVTSDMITKTIDSLENKDQQDFIRQCLQQDPEARPSVRKLLLHPLLFEVHALKLLATHFILRQRNPENSVEDILQHQFKEDVVIAEVKNVPYRISDSTDAEKLEKFIEEVSSGVYPLTCLESRPSGIVPDTWPGLDGLVDEKPPYPEFSQRVADMACLVTLYDLPSLQLHLSLSLLMESRMKRNLQCLMLYNEEPEDLVDDLVEKCLIHKDDREKVRVSLDAYLRQFKQSLNVPSLHAVSNSGRQSAGTGRGVTARSGAAGHAGHGGARGGTMAGGTSGVSGKRSGHGHRANGSQSKVGRSAVKTQAGAGTASPCVAASHAVGGTHVTAGVAAATNSSAQQKVSVNDSPGQAAESLAANQCPNSGGNVAKPCDQQKSAPAGPR